MDVVRNTQDSKSYHFARACNYLGLIANETKRPLLALEYFNQALKIHRKQLHPNNMRILACLNSIGMSHTELGQYESALTYHSQARELLCTELSAYIDMNCRNTASVYLRMGDLLKAEEWLKACPSFSLDEMDMMSKSARFAEYVRSSTATFSVTYLDNSDVMFMGMIRMRQNRLEEAFSICSKVLTFRRAKVGNRLRTCSTLYLIACILLKMDNLEYARYAG